MPVAGSSVATLDKARLENYLRDYGYVEARGMGIRAKVIPLMKQHKKTEPVFEATEDYVKTLLRKAQRHLNAEDVPTNAYL